MANSKFNEAIWNDTQIIVRKVQRTQKSLDRMEKSKYNGRSCKKVRVFQFDSKERIKSGEEFLENPEKNRKNSWFFARNYRPGTAARPHNLRGSSQNRLHLKNSQNSITNLASKFFSSLSVKGSTILTKPKHDLSTKAHSISDYIIGKDLGRGSYSKVKQATHKLTQKVFAVKIYEKSVLQSLQLRNAYTEIQILKSLSHPNIIKFHYFLDTPEFIYLFFDLISGPLLSDYVKSKPGQRLTEKEAGRIFFQLIQAVSYCHSKEILHRDIKLENILIDEKMNVKLVDFGFACLGNSKGKNWTYCGTPGYMAPEVIKKVSGNGMPADIWACGVVLFSIICGFLPFKGVNEIEYLKKINEAVLFIPNFITYGPRELIYKMLTVEVDKRIKVNEVVDFWWVRESGYKMEHSQSPDTRSNSSPLKPQNIRRSSKLFSTKRSHSFIKY